ncbi:MAG: transmembrane anchor protein [Pseudomonadota bacterium]
MYNVEKPKPSDLPTSKQLLRSTLIALGVAVAILVTVVLPAEYSIDPTGVGRFLGLTEMGEIKGQLAEEAAADAALDTRKIAGASSQGEPAAEVNSAATAAVSAWRDEMTVVLPPGQGTEVKLGMKAGEKAEFSWAAEGGVVNFDTHGDGGGQSISYEKGRGASADAGVIEAAFNGNHGWFWRNRGDSRVTVLVRARGQYAEMKKVM